MSIARDSLEIIWLGMLTDWCTDGFYWISHQGVHCSGESLQALSTGCSWVHACFVPQHVPLSTSRYCTHAKNESSNHTELRQTLRDVPMNGKLQHPTGGVARSLQKWLFRRALSKAADVGLEAEPLGEVLDLIAETHRIVEIPKGAEYPEPIQKSCGRRGANQACNTVSKEAAVSAMRGSHRFAPPS
eukprot:3659063-Amphidinium_carterae.2